MLRFGVRRSQFFEPRLCSLRYLAFEVVASRTCTEGHCGICKTRDKVRYTALSACVQGLDGWCKLNVMLGSVLTLVSFGADDVKINSLYFIFGYCRQQPSVTTFSRLVLDGEKLSFALDIHGCLDVVTSTEVAHCIVVADVRRIDAAKVSIRSDRGCLGRLKLVSTSPSATIVKGDESFEYTLPARESKPAPSSKHKDPKGDAIEAAFAACSNSSSQPTARGPHRVPPVSYKDDFVKMFCEGRPLFAKVAKAVAAGSGGGEGEGAKLVFLVGDEDSQSGTDADLRNQFAVVW